MRTLLTLYALAALAALLGAGPALPEGTLSAVAALPLIGIGLGAANLLSGLFQGNRANKLRGEALDIQREGFEAREPLRALSIGRLESMLGGPAPDLNAAFADPTNPFSSPVPRAMPAATAPPVGGGLSARPGRIGSVIDQISGRLGRGGPGGRAMPLTDMSAAARPPRTGAIPLRGGGHFGPII